MKFMLFVCAAVFINSTKLDLLRASIFQIITHSVSVTLGIFFFYFFNYYTLEYSFIVFRDWNFITILEEKKWDKNFLLFIYSNFITINLFSFFYFSIVINSKLAIFLFISTETKREIDEFKIT